jgi:Secretion system C-terminal sorting domain
MTRKLTLTLILSVCAFAFSKFSFAITYVDNGTNTNYDLNSGDSLFVATGIYTGSITGFDVGARITISDLATFTPGGMPHNANGTIHNYGIFTYTNSWTVNTNFKVNNYAGGIMTFGAITIRGNSQRWTNYTGGIIKFTGDVLMNGNADDLDNTMINYDSVRCDGNFQMNSGSAFTNYRDFNVGGTLRVNGGTLNNEGNLNVTGNILMNNGASVIRNYCRMQATGGITNTSGNFYNYSYLWAINSDITNSANIINSSVANGSVYAITTPMIHGRSYFHSSGGTMTGPALLYFYGTTSITGGTIGVPGVTTDTIKMYDVTRTQPTQIMDVQTGGTRHPNFIYNAWGIPDSTKNYLLGCSIEVIMESPLPIKWNYFFVSVSNKIPALTWSAEFSRGTVFNIQRSYNGSDFNTIDYIQSENGRSEYNYNDKLVNTNASIVYYRIKAREIDGQEKYTPVRVVRFGNSPMVSLQTAPNPFANNFNINYVAAAKGMITIRMFNVNGQQKLIKNVAVNNGNNIINVAEASRFAKGMYVIEIKDENGKTLSGKIMKQ